MSFAKVFCLRQKAATLTFLFGLMKDLSLKTGVVSVMCPIQGDPPPVRGSPSVLLFVTFFTDNIIENRIPGAMDFSIVAFCPEILLC